MKLINESKNTRVRAVFGIAMIVLGLGLIAKQFNLIPFSMERLIFSWPSLVVLSGILLATGKESRFTGYVLIGTGLFFLLPRIIPVPFEYRSLFWPVILVILGLLLIFRTSLFSKKDPVSLNDQYIDDVNIFGGHERRISSPGFSGGKITCVFGGGTYDFQNSGLQNGTNILNVVNIFGGTRLIVPSDWDVKVDIIAIFGGFNDKRINLPLKEGKSGKLLVIKGITIFGGGDITS